MQQDPEIKILALQKPRDPISRGFATAVELEKHFTTITNNSFYVGHKSKKYPAYKFRGDTIKYFNIIEVLDTIPAEKMTDTAKVLQDRYTVAKRDGNVNWDEIYKELKGMIYEGGVKPPKGSPRGNTGPRKKKAPKIQAAPAASDQPVQEAPALSIVPEAPAQAPAPAAKVNLSAMEVSVSPARLSLHLDITTEDADIIFEFSVIYQKIMELKRKSEIK